MCELLEALVTAALPGAPHRLGRIPRRRGNPRAGFQAIDPLGQRREPRRQIANGPLRAQVVSRSPSAYGRVICPGAWRAGQLGLASTRPEPAPCFGERRSGRIAGQECRHRHRCKVVARLAPMGQLAGVAATNSASLYRRAGRRDPVP
jgi:hypothetical protein